MAGGRVLPDVVLSMQGFGSAVAESFAAIRNLSMTQRKRIFKALVLDVYTRIYNETPVDLGYAQKGWNIEITEGEDWIAAEIWNGVVYIVALEYGHSLQAPNGMVRRNLAEAANRLRDARKELVGG